jgi:hypothetical protein
MNPVLFGLGNFYAVNLKIPFFALRLSKFAFKTSAKGRQDRTTEQPNPPIANRFLPFALGSSLVPF